MSRPRRASPPELASCPPNRQPDKETSPLGLTIAGVAVSIDGLDAMLHPRAHDLFRPFAERSDRYCAPPARIRVELADDASRWVVHQDGHEVMSTADPERLLGYLDWLAVSLALEASTQYAVFHCAALVRDSGAVLLVADSGAGKTTLTTGLMQRGWEPLGDDIALVDRETLAISAFPRCFHVDAASKALLADAAPLDWPAGMSGHARPTRWATGSYHVRTIAVVERCATCPSMRWPILQAQAAAALVSSAIRNQLPRSDVVRIAAQVAAGAKTCIRLRNGHLDGALNLIEGAARQ